MTGPLVDPFPWTRTDAPERIYSPAQFDRLVRRFLIAEELIRARDAMRERTNLGLPVETVQEVQRIHDLTRSFDALGQQPIPRQRIESYMPSSLDRVPVR